MTMIASPRPLTRPHHNGSPENGSSHEAAPHEIKYRQDAANYVAAMLAELRQIAGKAGFDKLVRSLDAAYYEAYGALDGKARESAIPPQAGGPNAAGEKISKSLEPNGG